MRREIHFLQWVQFCYFPWEFLDCTRTIEENHKLIDLKKTISNLMAKLFPDKWKEYAELRYWKNRKTSEGELSNDHYQYFYTTHFDLSAGDYKGRRILDIGCGPRGSLEWADMSAERVGLDPLADEYLKLGAKDHKMDYVSAPSEEIPFANSYFDFVCAFNSLDHVANLDQTISEIKRVTKPGGLFLLLVEINHEPTNCEPHMVTPQLVVEFKPEFEPENMKVYKPNEQGVYESIKQNRLYSNSETVTEQGWLSAKFRFTN